MKVIFAGPTLYGATPPETAAYELRPPARQGDIYRAVREGADVIGLIDGVYEYVPAIWHKEILYGLSLGVRIFGAASMGALRAAECAPFGMIGIGEIFEAYRSGELEDDADVAQAHGPEETDYLPLSEPLVNVRATIRKCTELGLITRQESQTLQEAATAMFFKNRTYRSLLRSTFGETPRATVILGHLRENGCNVKLLDALQLIDAVTLAPNERVAPSPDWTFEATSFWKAMFPDGSLA